MVDLAAPFPSSTPETNSCHLTVVESGELVQPVFSVVQLLQAVLEGFMDGVLIVNRQGKILEANSLARKLCQLSTSDQRVPRQVWQVCKALIESQKLFPGHRIIPELEETMGGINLRIRVRWWTSNPDLENQFEGSYLLVTLEDRQEAFRNLMMSSIQRYHLTTREAEVWRMRLQGCSYLAIASALYITQNTVKKHVKSILAKRREQDELGKA